MPTDRPDILLIVLDTMRRDRLSIYANGNGSTLPETSPHFDAFAANATLFERAVAPAQWTIPAHASMFTGLYPSTHQLTEADRRLSGSYPTLAEILHGAGYHTAGFCNNPLVGVLDNDLQRGFADFFNYAGAAPNRPLDVRRGGIRRALSRQWRRFAYNVSNRFAHSDWLFRVSLNPLLVPIWTRSINYKGHTARSIVDTTDYIATHRQNHPQTPLFTFLNLMGTHMPYRPPRDVLDRHAPEISRDKAAYRFMARFNAEAARWASPTDPPLSDWERAVIDGFYRAEAAHQDAALRHLFDHLRTSGALDNTLVIIAADHGEGHGDHDYFGHSFVVYQELVHVPLVIHYPQAFPAGARVRTNVSTRRIFHTVLDAVGVTPPIDEADPNADVQRLSLARAVNGAADSESGMAYSEAFPPQTFLNVLKHRQPHLIPERRLTQVRRGVYAGDRKLAMVGDAVEALFDVAADPAETRDLSGEQQAEAEALRARVGAFVTEAEQRRAGGTATSDVDDSIKVHLRNLGYLE